MSQDEFTQMLTTQMKEAVRLAIVTVLEEEITALIGALPHERSLTRTDRRNGHYTRDLDTTMGHIDDLAVPRTRNGHKTQLFERYARRRPELDEAIAGMFVKGVSTRGVGEVMESLTGSTPSASTVSRVFHTLEGE
jgi:putative transposase